MARIIRPLASWLALLERLNVPAIGDDWEFTQKMRDKIAEGWAPSDNECARIEKLRDTYGEKS